MTKLEEYKNKRDFEITNEPKAKIEKKYAQSLKYVIQHHKARSDHYDFRLEYEGVLKSWAVPKNLSNNPKEHRLAVEVEDHPLAYINFEGNIPKGQYGAGSVEIWDSGYYLPVENLKDGLEEGKFKVILYGKKLNGIWVFVKLDEKNWIATKSKLKSKEKEYKNTKKLKNPFTFVDVQLATLTSQIPEGKNWIFEIKYDGYRTLAIIENNKTTLKSRNNVDMTAKFKNVVGALNKISKDRSMILDGEIVVFDKNGKTDFGELQTSIKKGQKQFEYIVFDILALDGKDLRNEILQERKKILNKVIQEKNCIYISTYVIDKGKQCFALAKKLHLEGIVAKNLNSIYLGKRNDDWLKIKCYLRQEFVIVGYTKTTKNKDLSALLLGYYDKSKLCYIGKVGTGFDEKEKQTLVKMFNKLQIKNCPLEHQVLKEKNIVWLKPSCVAEIQFAEITKFNQLRQASYLGLRYDKNPTDVILEYKNAKTKKL